MTKYIFSAIIALLIGFIFSVNYATIKVQDVDNLGAKKVKEWEKSGSPLKLKADKSKILASSDVDEIRCGDNPNECINTGKIKEYYYIPSKKSEKVNIKTKDKNYSEVRRTNSAVIVKEETNLLGSSANSLEETYLFYGLGFYYLNGDWYDVEYSTTTIEAFEEQTATTTLEKIISFFVKNSLATDFLPGTNYDNSEYSDISPWQSRHDATTGTVRNSTTMYVQSSRDTSNTGTVERTQIVFDTSSLADDCTVSSASLSLKGTWERNATNPRTWNVFSENGDDTTPDGDDFNDCGTTQYSTSISDPNWDTSAGRNNVFTFNSTGKSAISLTSNSFFCVREATYDSPNTEPAQDSSYDGIGIASVRTTGTGDDPLLSVTCGAPAPSDATQVKQDITWFK